MFIRQITLGRALPAGLIIQLPEEWLVLEPETCYCLSLLWTPLQPTALRDTIRFTTENRGRHDVIVVLKTGMVCIINILFFMKSHSVLKKTQKCPTFTCLLCEEEIVQLYSDSLQDLKKNCICTSLS